MLPFPTTPRMTREERYYQFWDIINRAGQGGITATMLYRRAGLKRTPYSNGILKELVDTGEVVFDTEYLTNGMPVRIYYLLPAVESEVEYEEEGSDHWPTDPQELPF